MLFIWARTFIYNCIAQAKDEMRSRERKLEDQRHNLELSLSDAHQEIKVSLGPW